MLSVNLSVQWFKPAFSCQVHAGVWFSIATLFRSLLLQAGLEHTLRSILPSRWARNRPGPRGPALYLKLNERAELQRAKSVHLTMLFTKLASDTAGTDCRFVSLAQHLYFFGEGLNQIFAQQSTHVSSKFLLAAWQGPKEMQFPTCGVWIRFHTGVELMTPFPSTVSVPGIANNILLTWELKFLCTNALSIFIWQLQVSCMGTEESDSLLLDLTWFMCVVKVSQARLLITYP